MRTPAEDDDQNLTRAGYVPQFRRGLGSFAAFAAGFSYLSILTGIVQNFYLGYREAGPAFFWTWPAVFAGQFCLALCFAELAHRHPLCGGVYAWAGRAGSPALGWIIGWVYLSSLVVTLAAVALAWQVTLPAVWPGFHVLGSPAENAALLGVVLIALSTAINVLGTRWLGLLMTAGVVIELVAAVALVALLAGRAVRGPGVVFEARGGAADGFGTAGPFLAAAVMAAYVMYGFDTAGTLSEETVNPRRRTPRAILQALLAAAALGALLLVAALASASDLTDPLLVDGAGGLPHLIKQVLGETVGTVFVAAAALAVFICVLAVQAATARILFAMARDRAVPFAGVLARVHPKHRTPHVAAAVAGALAVAMLAFNTKSERLMTALVCVSIVWTNLAYLLTTGALLVRQLRGGPAGGDTYLGRWVVPVSALAVAWGVVLIINIGWPRERFYGPEWYERYGAVLYTAAMLAVGAGVYRVVRRGGVA